MQLEFKPVLFQEREALLLLIRAYYEFDQIHFDAAAIRPALEKLLNDASLGRAWFLCIEGKQIGYVMLTFGFDLEFGGRQATVTDLYIDPQHRGNGYGTAALQQVEQTCRSLGICAFELQVERSNHAALRFYEKFGMHRHDRIPMSKQIDP